MAETDPQLVRETARNIVLDHAKDVEYQSIGEMIADFDEFSSLPEAEFECVQGRIDKLIRNAVVTVTWPDEQAQEATDSAAAELRAWIEAVDRDGRRDAGYPDEDTVRSVLDNREVWRSIARKRGREHAALAARVAELERALADVDMTFRLPDGGGWCATCRLPMREGRTVVKTLAVVCEPCAAGLAVTAGRLDPTRLAARKSAELAAPDGRES